MRSIDFYLENIDNIIENNDISTMSNALTILIQYRDYHTPLFNELINKGIDWHKIDPNLANDWNQTIISISRLSKKLYNLNQ